MKPCHRDFFQKSQNRRFCFAIFSMKNASTEKNGVCHSEEHGKMKKMAVSDFSFLKLCHRDFCKTFSEIFNFLTPLHSQNAEEMDFCTLGPLKLCNLWAWLNCFLGVYGKSLGVQNDRLRQPLKMDVREKKVFFLFLTSVSPCTFPFFQVFFKKIKTGDFVSWFSPWKMCWSKGWSTPWWTAWKKQENSHLSFFILETLSQRFLQNIFRHFQFFEKIKNDEFAVTHSN